MDKIEKEYNVAEEKNCQVKDIADLLTHYFLTSRKMIVPLGTVISELFSLLKKQGWKEPE